MGARDDLARGPGQGSCRRIPCTRRKSASRRTRVSFYDISSTWDFFPKLKSCTARFLKSSQFVRLQPAGQVESACGARRHRSRVLEHVLERTHDSRLGDGSPRASGAYSTAPDRPNGQERSPMAERLGCTGRRARAARGAGAGAENAHENAVTCAGSCAVVIDRVSSLIRVHTTIHSSESHRVSATTASPAKF